MRPINRRRKIAEDWFLGVRYYPELAPAFLDPERYLFEPPKPAVILRSWIRFLLDIFGTLCLLFPLSGLAVGSLLRDFSVSNVLFVTLCCLANIQWIRTCYYIHSLSGLLGTYAYLRQLIGRFTWTVRSIDEYLNADLQSEMRWSRLATLWVTQDIARIVQLTPSHDSNKHYEPGAAKGFGIPLGPPTGDNFFKLGLKVAIMSVTFVRFGPTEVKDFQRFLLMHEIGHCTKFAVRMELFPVQLIFAGIIASLWACNTTGHDLAKVSALAITAMGLGVWILRWVLQTLEREADAYAFDKGLLDLDLDRLRRSLAIAFPKNSIRTRSLWQYLDPNQQKRAFAVANRARLPYTLYVAGALFALCLFFEGRPPQSLVLPGYWFLVVYTIILGILGLVSADVREYTERLLIGGGKQPVTAPALWPILLLFRAARRSILLWLGLQLFREAREKYGSRGWRIWVGWLLMLLVLLMLVFVWIPSCVSRA
jgi:hypothetical protein